MADNNLPQLPPHLGSEDYVEFKMDECRGCGERSPWVLMERDDNGKWKDHPGLWHQEHINEHGDAHAKFYEYTLNRAQGETWTPRRYVPKNSR